MCLQAAGQLQEEVEGLEGKVQELMTEELRQNAEWKCDECASFFASSDGLNKHVRMPGCCDRKKGQETGLTCPRCCAEFSKHGNWQRHVDYSPDCQSKKMKKFERDMKKTNEDATNGEEATNELEEATYEVEGAAPEVGEGAAEVEEAAAEVDEAANVAGPPVAASAATPTSTKRHFSHVRFTFNCFNLPCMFAGCLLSLLCLASLYHQFGGAQEDEDQSLCLQVG